MMNTLHYANQEDYFLGVSKSVQRVFKSGVIQTQINLTRKRNRVKERNIPSPASDFIITCYNRRVVWL